MSQNTSLLHSVSLILLIAGVLITLGGKGIFTGVFQGHLTGIKDFITGNDLIKKNLDVEEKDDSEENTVGTSRREIDGFDYNLFE
jgi:hypothetical protein